MKTDLLYALRTLRKSPGFTLIAMLALGLGIGWLSQLVALLAIWIPARRATRVDPMVALRYE